MGVNETLIVLGGYRMKLLMNTANRFPNSFWRQFRSIDGRNKRVADRRKNVE